MPEVNSIDELNQNIVSQLSKLRQTRIVPHTKKTIQEVFEQEKELLLPLPKYPFDCCVLVPAKVSKEARCVLTTIGIQYPAVMLDARYTLKGM